MQRLDTTLQRNESLKLTALFLFIFCASFVVAQSQPAAQRSQPTATQGTAQQSQTSGALPNGIHREGTDNVLVDASGIPLEDQSGKTLPQTNAATEASVPTTAPPNVSRNTTNVPAPEAPGRKNGPNGPYVYKSEVQEVVLHATVVDQHSRLVTNLNKNDFTVYEDGQPQVITRFSKEDVPVSIGILIDNSGSMRDKRQAVNTSALDLVKASNPEDEVFVVNFSDEAIIDTD
ncbi:MAG TPA: VWA domain-containing protein, partial [Terriglobales bacterium]|nr:VWA domain-containing protein [Terriglobales bacterium]